MNELVPEFSKEDFSSSKLYEYLYATISNGFVHEALREKISDMAISVGFKAFKRIYKKYCGQVGGVESKSVGNLTNFSKQPMQLESGDK